MLSYESILNEAALKGMPTDKWRGIIREYIQTLILKYIYRTPYQDKFFFLGGTSLRLLYDLRRFSEDLDFNVKGIKEIEFEETAKFIKDELSRENIDCLLEFNHRKPLYIAEFIFEEFGGIYKADKRKGGMLVKLEANLPDYEFPADVHSISSFGEIFLVKAMAKEWVFADKIDTLRNKKLGRHIYDIIFMLGKRFKVSREMLKIHGITEEPKEAISKIINSISDEEFKRLSKQVAPFLFDEGQRDLVIKAKMVIAEMVAQNYP
ncbi:MAG: nucleotidyl transferase AbiEii/AbiGii toxin family protein [Nitrospirota bacterium]